MKISKDFNLLIEKFIDSYQQKKKSCLYRFFASSWVAQSPVRARDDIKKFQPWNSIKQAMTAFLAGQVVAPRILLYNLDIL